MATTSATEHFRRRFTNLHPSHFRPLQDLWASSIGAGTYLGDPDERTDLLYAEALAAAANAGCNLWDTALNYRCQRSERVLGRVLETLLPVTREELILCTKGGYVAFDGAMPADPARYVLETVVNAGLAAYEEIAAGCHCISPAYIDRALHTSLNNLRVRTIDVYYLHNPEQQLEGVERETFHQRFADACELLEQRVRDGMIRYYGAATWNGFRARPTAKDYLSLDALIGIAERVGGSHHHFRVIQLPYNLAMPEASTFRNQTVKDEALTILEAAERLGISVIVSASLLQGQLARLTDSLAQYIPGLSTAAQRALQFVRSTPGVTAALVGMKQRAHAMDNLALARQPLLPQVQLAALFDRPPRRDRRAGRGAGG